MWHIKTISKWSIQLSRNMSYPTALEHGGATRIIFNFILYCTRKALCDMRVQFAHRLHVYKVCQYALNKVVDLAVLVLMKTV